MYWYCKRQQQNFHPVEPQREGKQHAVNVSIILLPTGSEERGVLGFGSIPVAILTSCQNMKLLHYNCKNINIVG